MASLTEHNAADGCKLAGIIQIMIETVHYVGDQPEFLTDPATDGICKVHVFATTLALSSRVYAEVFPDEKMPGFIAGVVHAPEYYGTVPIYLVPDNLKAAISKHSKDELILNSASSDWRQHFSAIHCPH